MVRMSHSNNRDDINKKYSLDKLAKIDAFNKNRDTSFAAQFEESKQRSNVISDSNVVIAPITALLTAGTNKTIFDKYLQQYPKDKFDTVIVDDANMLDETDLV